jgi:ankyrin repeat protein
MGNLSKATEEINKDSSLANFIEPKYGNSLLLWAVLNNNEKAVELLLKSGAVVNKFNFFGDSPLEVSALYNTCDSEILQILLKYQPIDDSLTIYIRNEALINASKNCLNNVKLLVKNNANPLWISKKGEVFNSISPLAMSVIQEKYDITEYYLFELGIDPSSGNIINSKENTILMIDILQKSYSAKRTFDQEKTRQQIQKILDYIKSKEK